MDEETEKPRGNYAPRGRRRQRITLDEQHAQLLHLLWRVYRRDDPTLTKTALIEGLLRDAAEDIPKPDLLALLQLERPPLPPG